MTRRSLARSAAVLLAATLGAGAAAPVAAQTPDGLQQDRAAQVGDLYAWVSPDQPGSVTIVTTWGGAHAPSEWATQAWFDPDLTYWIKVDNDGDGSAEITWSFTFTTRLDAPDSVWPTGFGQLPSTPPTVIQEVNVRRDDVLLITAQVPPPNIGPRTTPAYASMAANYLSILDPGRSSGRIFAGQRDDPMFGDLGALADLLGIRGKANTHAFPVKKGKAVDTRSGMDTLAIAIQVPISELTADGSVPSVVTAPGSVIGIWAGASRPGPGGDPVQVSRVGAPLIEQWLIPYGQKDAWRAGDPSTDAGYESWYLQPELAGLLAQAYPKLPAPRTTDRTDIAQVLGRGIPGLTQTATEGVADQLRLNLAVPPTKKPNRLGVMGGDLAGYPNGRRPTDDVVDITLRMMGDGYGASFAELLGTAGVTVTDNKAARTLGDGCARNDAKAIKDFPYLGTPWDGVKGGTTHKACPAK